MTLFQYISSNFDRIKYDIKIGLIPCSLLKHFQVYSRYDYYRKLNNSVSKSITFVGIDLNVNDSWIYTIIKKMEREV